MLPVTVNGISFAYNGHKVLENVSLEIEGGKVSTILGPNGSGKTTLLKIILGLLKPDSGSILIDGRNLSELEPRERAKILAYVPQKHIPAFSFPVIEVVAMGRHPYSSVFAATSNKDLDIAAASLARLNVGHLRNRPYTELSGGEQQLVLIARALTQQASILVFDEPVSGLDYGNQLMLLKQMRALAKEGITCINTSHFPEHALWTSDVAIFINHGQIIAQGPALQVITRENLEKIYHTRINIVKVAQEPGQTCVPDFSETD